VRKDLLLLLDSLVCACSASAEGNKDALARFALQGLLALAADAALPASTRTPDSLLAGDGAAHEECERARTQLQQLQQNTPVSESELAVVNMAAKVSLTPLALTHPHTRALSNSNPRAYPQPETRKLTPKPSTLNPQPSTLTTISLNYTLNP
jgi:hypothetical protein